MSRRLLVIDTDPGVDDAIAILLAIASPEVELAAVTTVFGNVSVRQTTENALRILALAGARNIPVAAGAARPLIHPQPRRGSHTHGANGLGGVELSPADRRAEPTGAVRFLADLLQASSRPVTVCAIGPLTNIALLVGSDPAAAARIDRLVVMGGAYGAGSTTGVAEFNALSDPEAAQRVLNSGLPITVVGMDVTRQAALDLAAVERIGASGPVGAAGAAMLVHSRTVQESDQRGGGVVVHDALAVLEVIIPGVVQTDPRAVTVDCGQGAGRGRTLAESCPAPRSGPDRGAQLVPQPQPVRVAQTVDSARAGTEIAARLCSYPR
ncbi:MAG: nucleoside hydrolase [Actinomycetota bacterium]|nr:nucleoside hydrolase [Actinomycetota bacterium]